MTKAKTTAPEDQAPAAGDDPALFQAQTEGQDAAGADASVAGAEQAELEAFAAANPLGLDAADPEPPAAPELNLSALTYCARQIDMLNTSGHRLGLIDELKQLYGARIVETEGEGVTVSIEGITTDPSDCVETALANWANAARRACLEATA